MRRQKYFTFILQDILYHAYQRSVEVGRSRKLPRSDYADLFTVSMPDISRSDNETLARSARDIMDGMQTLADQLPGRSESFTKQMIRMMFKFSGEPQAEEVVEKIYQEAVANSVNPNESSSGHSEELL